MELPYPPSLNAYYIPIQNRMTISRAGRRYREQVRAGIRTAGRITGKCAATLEFYPPDNRKRDLDNLFKCFFDAIKYGLIGDDSEIKIIHATMGAPVPPSGMVHLKLTKIKPGQR